MIQVTGLTKSYGTNHVLRGIDLSVGSVLALAGTVTGMLVKAGMPVVPAAFGSAASSSRSPGSRKTACPGTLLALPSLF